jgi:aspartate/methionine/tyrosine aminotransferase
VEKKKNYKFDLAWGNPYFLLEILDNHVSNKLQYQDIAEMNYAPDLGIERLREFTKNIIANVTGLSYKNVLITAGATQALNSIMRYERQNDIETVLMNQYGFPFYSDMVQNSGLRRQDITKKINWTSRYVLNNSMIVLDSPSNPLGKQDILIHPTVYWDSVYHSKIYNADMKIVPQHKAMVGSYSKLLGLSGARIGWIATNDDFLFESLSDVVLKDTATVSVPSQNLLLSVLEQINLDWFLNTGKRNLDNNREEVSQIKYIFDGQEVPEVGMFYCIKADKKAIDTLEKASIKFTKLDEDTVRISLGQRNTLTYNAVQAILKEDAV